MRVNAPTRRQVRARRRFIRLPPLRFGTRTTRRHSSTSSAGHVYSRISNPTTAVLEERIAALEGGVGAIATASGQAAMHLAIATLMGAGSHIVSSQSIYGGTHNLLEYTLPRFGIDTTFVNPSDIDAIRAAIRPHTRLVFGETLGNPGLDVLDIPRVAAVAHESGLPLLWMPRLPRRFSRNRSSLVLINRAFSDKVPERPWCGDWWTAGRQRHIRLGEDPVLS